MNLNKPFPRCIREGCDNPVKKACGAHKPTELGYRYVDGVRWRWFCSRACSGLYRIDGLISHPKKLEAFVEWTLKGRRAALARMIEMFKPFMTEDGMIPAKKAAEVMLLEVRRQRSSAASSVIQRVKRRGLTLEEAWRSKSA